MLALLCGHLTNSVWAHIVCSWVLIDLVFSFFRRHFEVWGWNEWASVTDCISAGRPIVRRVHKTAL